MNISLWRHEIGRVGWPGWTAPATAIVVTVAFGLLAKASGASRTQVAQVLLTGLQFANGVVLDPDERFVLVAETGSYRITRLWLTGERAGCTDAFVDGLPGFPDNISLGSDGLVWVALPSPRDPVIDVLFRLPSWARRAAWRLPESWQPSPKGTVWVQAYDLDGQLVHDLQAPGAELVAQDDDGGERRGGRPVFHTVTGVRELDGWVYLGSLECDRIAVFAIDAATNPDGPGAPRPDGSAASEDRPAAPRPGGSAAGGSDTDRRGPAGSDTDGRGENRR